MKTSLLTLFIAFAMNASAHAQTKVGNGGGGFPIEFNAGTDDVEITYPGIGNVNDVMVSTDPDCNNHHRFMVKLSRSTKVGDNHFTVQEYYPSEMDYVTVGNPVVNVPDGTLLVGGPQMGYMNVNKSKKRALVLSRRPVKIRKMPQGALGYILQVGALTMEFKNQDKICLLPGKYLFYFRDAKGRQSEMQNLVVE